MLERLLGGDREAITGRSARSFRPFLPLPPEGFGRLGRGFEPGLKIRGLAPA